MRKNITVLSILAVMVIACIFVVNLLPNFFFKKGLAEYKAKDFVAAHKHIGIAKTLKPKNKEYRYNYVLSLASIKPTYAVQKEMFELSKDKAYDSAARLAIVQVDFWNRKLRKTYGHNYIEQTPYGSQILRWDTSAFPLKVSIDFPIEDKLPNYYRAEITKAFYQWQNATQFLKFDFVNNVKDAQIVIKFLPLPENNCTKNGCRYVVAYTEPTIKNNILKKMTITLYDKDAYGNYFSDKELYNTILHEIGHALGIMGHSYSTDDLMFMSNEEEQNSIYTRFRSRFQYISSKDINTVTLLYNLMPDISSVPISKINNEKLIYPPVILGTREDMQNEKLKEAQDYIKKAPHLPGGYLDLAIIYAEAGKKNKAIVALTKALELSQTPDEKFIAYYNLAAVEMNSNNLSKALEYAQKAQEIDNNDDIANLISNIMHAINAKKKPFKDKMISQ